MDLYFNKPMDLLKKMSQYVSTIQTIEELIKSKTSAGVIPIDDSNEILKILYDAREELESGDGKKKVSKFFVPSFEEVEVHFQAISGNKSKSSRFTHAFMDHYTANGWKIGKVSMVNWKAAVSQWYRRDIGSYPNESVPTHVPVLNNGIPEHLKMTKI